MFLLLWLKVSERLLLNHKRCGDSWPPDSVLKQDTLLLYNPKECRGEESLSFLPPWEFQTPLSLGTPGLLINLPRNWLSHESFWGGWRLQKDLCPWGFLSKVTGVGCHFLLQGIFSTQRSNLGHRHWQADSFTTEPPWKLAKGQWSIKKTVWESNFTFKTIRR